MLNSQQSFQRPSFAPWDSAFTKISSLSLSLCRRKWRLTRSPSNSPSTNELWPFGQPFLFSHPSFTHPCSGKLGNLLQILRWRCAIESFCNWRITTPFPTLFLLPTSLLSYRFTILHPTTRSSSSLCLLLPHLFSLPCLFLTRLTGRNIRLV